MHSQHIYIPNLAGPYPKSLTSNDYWSIFDLVWSDKKQKFSKIPIDLKTGLPANSETMSGPFSFAKKQLGESTVLSYYQPERSAMHLGLIDCDNCIAPDGSISSLVQNLLRYVDSYAELSVSNGVHVLCWLDDVPLDGHRDREWNVEFYWGPRSVPITGNRIVLADWQSPEDVQPGTEKFLKLHKSRFKDAWLQPSPAQSSQTFTVLSREEVLSRLFREAQGEKWAEVYAGNWQAHYESPSDADLALLIKFSFYSGQNRQMMELMFSECPLSKILIRGTLQKPTVWRTPKWNNVGYRKRSLDAAIERTSKVYEPPKRQLSPQEMYKMRRQQIHEDRKKQ